MDRRTAVIAEDEPLIALEMRYLCEDLGYQVLGVAASEDQARKRFAELSPDLLITDMELADGSDGVGVAVQMRNQCPEIMVVFVTATTSPAKLDRIRSSNPHHMLRKPIQIAELSAALLNT